MWLLRNYRRYNLLQMLGSRPRTLLKHRESDSQDSGSNACKGGDSENAVRIQTYTAIISYCLVAIVHHKMKLETSVYNALQVIGISLTDTTPLIDLFNRSNLSIDKEFDGFYEPILFDF